MTYHRYRILPNYRTMRLSFYKITEKENVVKYVSAY